MKWIYRLQQRVAITTSESTAIGVVALLLLVGVTAQYVRSQGDPIPLAAEVVAVPEAQVLPTPDAPSPEQAAYRLEGPSQHASASSPEPSAATGPINVNTATVSELERLPRIGPKMAARIVAHREARGAFRRVEDLTAVRGIGPKTLDHLRPLVTVE